MKNSQQIGIGVVDIRKRFGAFAALDSVSLDIRPGELTALLGPSGCGKTTLLRIIAGLEKPDGGRITFNGEDAHSRSLRERGIGFVFQHYALFRHMSVFENVAFGIRAKSRKERPGPRELKHQVEELLSLVQLDGLAHRTPKELSGGQRQRVALARALAVRPRVLLLDEPFGALDAGVRRSLRRWLRRLHEEVRVTSVFVTHDQEEALEVADTVVVMNKGRIEQVGNPDVVYGSPANPFVMSFLGDVNLFHGREDSRGFQLHLPGHNSAGPEDHIPQTALYVRPHEIELSIHPRENTLFSATVEQTRPIASLTRVELRHSNGHRFSAELPRSRAADLALEVGSVVHVALHGQRTFYTSAPKPDYEI